MSCDAKRVGDEMHCGRCGLQWDVNDPDRPPCRKTIDRRAIPERRVTNLVRKLDMPEEKQDEQIQAMRDTLSAAISSHPQPTEQEAREMRDRLIKAAEEMRQADKATRNNAYGFPGSPGSPIPTTPFASERVAATAAKNTEIDSTLIQERIRRDLAAQALSSGQPGGVGIVNGEAYIAYPGGAVNLTNVNIDWATILVKYMAYQKADKELWDMPENDIAAPLPADLELNDEERQALDRIDEALRRRGL